ncbi:hypothetical protein V492_05465 [Pseudogymnoascus sp. VKM F-4246]|nr:hypothetical protein V492_05465 [Pseudogymnoascus sp. VKM F-4246]
MQLSHFLLAAGAVLSGVAPASAALPKYNQYPTLDDCKNDKNILYHTAPYSGHCYDLMDEAGAYFFNTGGFLNCNGYEGKGCYSEKKHFSPYSGNCYSKDVQSVMCS